MTKEKDFAPVPIGKIEPDEALCTAIYLRIGEKFVKYKDEGDCIDGEKYNQLLSKNLKDVYIALADVKKFMEWIKAARQKSVDEMVADVGEEHREIVERREDIKEKVYETFSDLELDSGIVEILQSQVKEFISEIQERKTPKEVIARLLKHNSSIADHCVNTANIATYLAMLLGHGNQSVLEHVYLGALYHDYGKAKIPASVLENVNNTQYNQAIQDHPIKGAKMLSKLPDIHKQVLTIVQQHHEHFNGKGYPKGLAGDDIFGLSKIVSIANIFDNVLVENARKPKLEKYKTAIKNIEYDKGKQFDPEIVEKIMEGLRLAYTEEYKGPVTKENIQINEDS